MPLRPSVGDCAEVVIHGHFLSNNQAYVTVLGMYKATMTTSDLVTVASAVSSALIANLDHWSADVFFNDVTVRSVDTANPIEAQQLIEQQGTLGGTADNPAIAKCYVLKTAVAQRYATGRIYKAGYVTSDRSAPQDNKFIGSRISYHMAALSALGAAINASAKWSVISYHKTFHFDVTSIGFPNNKVNFRTQRSEGN